MAYPSETVKQLRQAGKPTEAYEAAVKYIQEGELNKYLESELAWALYDCMKAAKGAGKDQVVDAVSYAHWFELAAKHNINYENNTLFYENLGKLNASVVWALQAGAQTQSLIDVLHALGAWGERWTYFSFDYKEKMFHYFLRGFKPDSTLKSNQAIALRAQGMVDLMEWYTMKSFAFHASYETTEKDGRTLPSEAERTTKAYLDSLLTKVFGEPCISLDQRKRGVQAINTLLTSGATKDKCADWVWVRYKYAQLLLEVESPEVARPFFEQMLLARPAEAYLWGALAETYKSSDKNAYAACLFKGLAISRNTQMSLSMHEKAAQYFVESENFAAAKREVLIVSEYRSSQGWKPSAVAAEFEKQIWYGATDATENNDALYQQLSASAQNLLFAGDADDSRSYDFYLERIDAKYDKLYVWLENDKHELVSSSIKDAQLASSLRVGEVYHGVFTKDLRQIMSLQDVAPRGEFKSLFIKDFTGILDRIKDFAFVRTTSGRSLYVSAQQLEAGQFPRYCLVRGRMVLRHVLRDGERVSEFVVDTLEFAKELDSRLFKRTLSGTYVRPKVGDFAFVSNIMIDMSNVDEAYFLSSDACFVPPAVASDKIANGALVRVKAERRWNKKKNEWGWEAKEILL